MKTLIIISATFLTIISLGIAFIMTRNINEIDELCKEQKGSNAKNETEELLATIKVYLDYWSGINEFGKELLEDAAKMILEKEEKIRELKEERDLAQKLMIQRYEDQSRQVSTQADWMP